MSGKNKPNRGNRRKRSLFKRKSFWIVSGVLVVLAVASGITGFLVFQSYTTPYRERAKTYDLDRINELEVPSLIVDRNGKEIGRFFVQNRSVIEIGQVSELFLQALKAGEDSRFDTHDGVDYIGIMRAAYLNWRAKDVNQGASTITQQLARNAYNLKQEARNRKESEIERKLVEAFLAREIEKRYSKRQILEFYLNRIYFGSGFYGIRSASLGYYGKEPMDLTLLECASIVGLIKNPTNLSPLNSKEANRRTRNNVLRRMAEEGMIKEEEAARLSALPVQTNPKPLRRGTTHLYERIAEDVGRALGEDALESGGFKIHTTILAEAQTAAEDALQEALVRAENHQGFTRKKFSEVTPGEEGADALQYLQGAVLLLDHRSGEVLAHVGGRNYAQVPYDFIEQGRRPLGTAFFPFLYASALASGKTPGDLLQDLPINNRALMIGGIEGIPAEWGMEVERPKYENEITLRRAFEAGKIAATVQLANEVGLDKIAEGGAAFGFPMASAERLPRLSVGWESASMKEAVRAIAAFAREGRAGPDHLVYVDRVDDPSGRVVFRRKYVAAPPHRILDEAMAFQVHDLMRGGLARGSAEGALDDLVEKPFTGAWRGGSTYDFGDTWFLGYNAQVTCGVWTGFLQGNGDAIYPGAFSRDIALPVWQAAMNAVTPSFGGVAIEPPASVVKVEICRTSGQQATEFCQELVEDLANGTMRSRSTAITEYFRRGTEKIPFCALHSGALTDGVSPGMALKNLPTLDSLPILPKQPLLIGDDPYHTELPSFIPTSSSAGLGRRRTNVLDSLDLGEGDEMILLKRPSRLQIHED